MALLYFGWFGAVEELSEMEEILTVACARVDAIDYKRALRTDNRKFYFFYAFETKSYEKLLEVLTDPKMLPRHYKKLTHGMFEILRGPLEQ